MSTKLVAYVILTACSIVGCAIASNKAAEYLTYYDNGQYITKLLVSLKADEDMCKKGGHQPWRQDPVNVAAVMTANLLPAKTNGETIHRVDSIKNNKPSVSLNTRLWTVKYIQQSKTQRKAFVDLMVNGKITHHIVLSAPFGFNWYVTSISTTPPMSTDHLSVRVLDRFDASSISQATLNRSAKKNGWFQMKGQVVSSVVWSPDGRNIAFVATPQEPANNDDIFVVTKASIWLLSVSDSIGVPRLLRTLKVNNAKGCGTPVGLFWLTGKKIGWATSECKIFTTDLQNGKTRTLINSKVMLEQSRSFQDSYGFDDVYYDPRSHQLIVTGSCEVCIYDTKTSKLQELLFPKISRYLTMSSWTSPYKTRGSYKRNYYLTGIFDNSMVLWRASGNPHNQNEWIVKRDTREREQRMLFPRPSPDGHHLLWMESPADISNPHYDRWNIVLYQTISKTRRVIAHIPDARHWYDIVPGLGCPFSWSPTGDKIAFAYGSTIRILPAAKPAKWMKNPDKLVFLDVYSDLSGRQGRMHVWSSNGQPHEIPLPYQPYQFCFNPGGDKIAFVGASKPGNWACLMCLTWMKGNKKLVFGVTSAKRTVFSGGEYSEIKGPGGIW